jgi:hypothetical protein
MIERNKITISFLPYDSDLWDFIQNKKETCNISEYIRNLIRQDMDNHSSFIDEDKIVERILHALQNNEVIVSKINSEVTEHFLVNEETKNTINSLF